MKGAVAVPLCTSHRPPEMAHVISDSAPTIVFYTKEFAKFVEEEVIPQDLVAKMPGKVSSWICIDDVKNIGCGIKSGDEIPAIDLKLDSLDRWNGGLIIYTSGTTGKPKGVLSTYSNIEAQVSSLLKAWEWTNKDKIQLLLPLHHVHGVINVLTCGIAAGATVEMVPGKLDPKGIWRRWMEPQRDLTLFMAVPTIYCKYRQARARLISHYGKEMGYAEQNEAYESCSQFRLMVSGNFKGLLERYGMTEIGMALGNPLSGPRVGGSVGLPFPGVSCRLMDENGTLHDALEKPDISGELVIKGPQVFKEYWGRPDATNETFTSDGWFKTGDVATTVQVTDSQRYYKILGRASVDIIKTGGHKMSALGVERELLSCPLVHDVAVVGVPDEEWGERVGAVVAVGSVAGKSEKSIVEEMRTFLKSRIANWEVPSLWKIVEELPRNAMGKVNKKDLRRVFLEI
ncbi:hypothetical protein HDU97_008814 [Phlyctochytrium planicorne]|nr:hypothetical protein HDU97_008814 [Phlyctochytrium planicorne]